MLHRQHRQLEADHPPDLAGPQPAGVDDVLGVDRVAASVMTSHVPSGRWRAPSPACAVRPRRRADLGATCVGVGDAVRIDVALDRVVQRADEVLRLEQREERRAPRRA